MASKKFKPSQEFGVTSSDHQQPVSRRCEKTSCAFTQALRTTSNVETFGSVETCKIQGHNKDQPSNHLAKLFKTSATGEHRRDGV